MRFYTCVVLIACFVLSRFDATNVVDVDTSSAVEFDSEPDADSGLQSIQSIATDLNELLNAGKAQEAYESIQSLDPEYRQDESILIAYGRALVQLGKVHEGRAVFEKILQINPGAIEANLLMAKLFMRDQAWDQAEKHLDGVLRSDPDHPVALNFKSKVVLLRDSNPKQALALITKAAKLDPQNAEIQFDLGMMLFYAGQHAEGKEAFEEAARLNPAVDQSGTIGKTYVHFGQYEWAVEALEKTVKAQYSSGQQPDPSTLALLGELLDSTGYPQDALTYYRATLELDPKNAIAHAGVGLILLGTSNFNYAAQNACGLNQEEALDHLQAAYQLDPSMKSVEAALLFCEQEIGEVRSWRQISKSTSADSTKILKATQSDGLIQSLVRKIIQPVDDIKRWVREHLERFGLCSRQDGKSLLPKAVCDVFRTATGRAHSKSRTFADSVKDKLETWALRDEALPKVPRVAIESADELNQLLTMSRPVIITNFQDSWGADGNTQFDFSKHALIEKFGSEMVRVSVSETGRFDGPENGTLWGLDANIDVLVRPPQTSMLLGDFITLLEKSRQPGSTVRETFYAEYMAMHQYLGEEFSNLVPWPEFLQELNVLSHLVSNVWIGGVPTSSPLHYDDYENFLSQLRGVKEVILFPPSDYPNLYYVKRPKGKLQYEYPSTFIRDVAGLDKRAYVFGSSVNLDQPDLSRHPRFVNTHPIRAVLQAGDTLYIPAFWHHEVQSVPVDGAILDEFASDSTSATKSLNNDPRGDYLNVAVNFWFKNLTAPYAGM